MMEKLTVLIPCKDERHNIRACVESIRDIADEILIADSGSTDGTLDVVQQIGGCRVIQREYINSANFKNWAIPQAKYSWVFILDADERVTDKLRASIQQVLTSPPEHLDGYWISYTCFFMGHSLRFSRWGTDSIRLIRRDVCRYQTRRVHADIDICRQRVAKLSGKLLHYSYWSFDEYFSKYGRYTSWGAQELWDRGKRAGYGGLLIRPLLRFFYLYVARLGFLDGLPGLQVCMLTAFFNTYVKQAKLWEMEHVKEPYDLEMDSSDDAAPHQILPLSSPRSADTVAGLPGRQKSAA